MLTEFAAQWKKITLKTSKKILQNLRRRIKKEIGGRGFKKKSTQFMYIRLGKPK